VAHEVEVEAAGGAATLGVHPGLVDLRAVGRSAAFELKDPPKVLGDSSQDGPFDIAQDRPASTLRQAQGSA